MDFTNKKYSYLLKSLINNGYHFISNLDFRDERAIFLRHDVDRLPKNALKLANLAKDLGVKSTYYFRVLKKINDPVIMQQISEMGHEIGYQ